MAFDSATIRKWIDQLNAIIDGEEAHCPLCGGKVEHEFFARPDRWGYALLTCTICKEKFHMSKMQFSEGVPTKEI